MKGWVPHKWEVRFGRVVQWDDIPVGLSMMLQGPLYLYM